MRGFARFLKMNAGRPKILVTRKIPAEAWKLLEQEGCELTSWNQDSPIPRTNLISMIQPVDALFCLLTDKIDKEVLDKAEKLSVVATMSVGSDHLDLEELKKREIKVGFTPNVLNEATAELTLSLLLATSRRLIEASKEVYNGGWGSWSPMWMCGKGLHGSTVGIVGLGRIGTAVVEKLRPFHPTRILYNNRQPNPELEEKLGVEYADFHQLLSASDFVIATCPLNAATRGLFDRTAFRAMKPDAIFINTSRGPVVDQDALLEALSEKWIRAAGLDVCYPEPLPLNHPLLKQDNLVLLPHIGSATEETRTRMAILTSENIIAGLRGRPMPSPLPL